MKPQSLDQETGLSEKYAMISTRREKFDALTDMVNKGSLTSDGRDWLTCALDPYHDFNHTLAGYPDAAVSQTVVSCYQYQTTVTAPAGVAGDWDAHIFTLPIAFTQNYSVYNQGVDWTTITDPNPTIAGILGPLNIISNAVGSPLVPVVPVSATQARQCLPALGVEEAASGCSRIIAMGFEVHNTTADIYKQGAVCSYRMPTAPGQNMVMFLNNAGPPATSYGSVSGKRFPQPPPTQADAMRMKTSRTWDAREGVYSTVFQSSVDNPLVQMSNQQVLFGKDADPGVAAAAWGSPLAAVPGPANPTVYAPLATKTTPFDVTGAFFTGLSNQTSLTVKLRLYVERAPGWNLPDLAPLASPSAGYDIAALELYAQAINALPAAVKVSENGAGDWWRAVTGVLKHVAAPAGALLNTVVPGAGLIGSAVQTIAGQLDTTKPIAKQVLERLPTDMPRRQLTTMPAPQFTRAQRRARGRQAAAAAKK